MDMKQISSLLVAVALLWGVLWVHVMRIRAERGNAHVQLSLGHRYVFGKRKSHKEAVKWLREAAMQGNTTAQRSLGAMYGIGWGVPRDEVEAHAWALLADAISNSDSPPSISFDDHMYSPGIFLTTWRKKESEVRARAAELLRLIKKRNSKWFRWYKEDGVYKYKSLDRGKETQAIR